MKNVIGILDEIGSVLGGMGVDCHWYFNRNCIDSVDCLGEHGHFNNINSSNPRTWCIFPSVCVVFNFFHQCQIVFQVQVFYLLRQVYS